MGREWKSGDVARLRTSLQEFAVVALFDGKFWNFAGGCSRPEIVWDVRPLVVIDPEDREQVERLCDVIDNAFNNTRIDGTGPDSTELAQAALREFANPTPPKPPEPTSPAVRVIDNDGDEWARSFTRLGGRWSSLSSLSGDQTWDSLVDNFGPVEVKS